MLKKFHLEDLEEHVMQMGGHVDPCNSTLNIFFSQIRLFVYFKKNADTESEIKKNACPDVFTQFSSQDPDPGTDHRSVPGLDPTLSNSSF